MSSNAAGPQFFKGALVTVNSTGGQICVWLIGG